MTHAMTFQMDIHITHDLSSCDNLKIIKDIEPRDLSFSASKREA